MLQNMTVSRRKAGALVATAAATLGGTMVVSTSSAGAVVNPLPVGWHGTTLPQRTTSACKTVFQSCDLTIIVKFQVEAYTYGGTTPDNSRFAFSQDRWVTHFWENGWTSDCFHIPGVLENIHMESNRPYALRQVGSGSADGRGGEWFSPTYKETVFAPNFKVRYRADCGGPNDAYRGQSVMYEDFYLQRY